MTKGHGFDQPTAERIMAYVWDIRDRLHLQHWTVGLHADRPAKGNRGSMMMGRENHVAAIMLPPDFLEEDPSEQRDTIVHELLHLQFRDLQDTVDRELFDVVQGQRHTLDAFHERFRIRLERTVSDLARIIAATMPEVPWADTTEAT